MDDFPLDLGGFDMSGTWTVAFFASDIEFHIFGLVSSGSFF
jgi:hypothetical protein